MKEVVVRKRYSHRMAIRFFMLIFFAVPVVLAFCIDFPVWLAILMCSPVIVGVLAMLLYYETWQIRFDSSSITRRVFGFSCKEYSYHQIRDVIYRWSYTEQGIIRIIFTDSRSIKFRTEDENAEKARKKIQSHHSIRNIN